MNNDMKVSLIEIGWAAGFYEGEGSFIEPGYVSICQKDREPLYRIWRSFGGSEPKIYNGFWYWRLHGVEMRQFVLTIFSLLTRRRKDQILKLKHVFVEEDTCRNGHLYPRNTRTYYNPRTGGEFRTCSICQRANQQRKNAKRRMSNQLLQEQVNV